jgi:ATP-binding cassette subfamily B multidrug efflux pump
MHTDFGYFEETHLGKSYDARMLMRLYPFTRPYKVLLAFSIILIVLITLLDLCLPYVTKIAVDRYIVPRIEVTRNANADAAENKTRYLRVNLTNPEIKTVVQKYSNQFKIFESFALIEYDDLEHIKTEDLALLRKGDLDGVTRITVVFLAIILISFVIDILQVVIMEYTGQMIMHDLRVRLFKHIQSLSLAFFSPNPDGRLVTRVTNDIQNMHELFTSVIAFVFKDLFLLIGITVVLIGINWHLALISFMVLPIVLAASLHFSSQAREGFRVL